MTKMKHNFNKIKSGFLGILVFLAISFITEKVSAQKSDTLKVGTTSWTCPAGVNSVQIECWGGGGSGGGISFCRFAGGCSGGGLSAWILTSPG